MKKTALVVMAAGMGSRFGGPKQITPVGCSGEKIIDYSVFDAVRAGFNEVIFVVNEKIKADFIEAVGEKISKHIPVKYVVQDINNIPEGFTVPEGRTKPWGTGHAMLSCKDAVDCPFMIINADDFYGSECFKVLHEFLQTVDENDANLQFAMAGYKLGNTVTDKGSFSRGICVADENGYLKSITEHTDIYAKDGNITFTLDGGKTFAPLAFDDIASLNCWAFDKRIIDATERKFTEFLSQDFANPLKAEFFLPTIVDELINEGKATAKVLHTDDKWYGMTYTEDKIDVQNAIKDMVAQGIYPEKLWD